MSDQEDCVIDYIKYDDDKENKDILMLKGQCQVNVKGRDRAKMISFKITAFNKPGNKSNVIGSIETELSGYFIDKINLVQGTFINYKFDIENLKELLLTNIKKLAPVVVLKSM